MIKKVFLFICTLSVLSCVDNDIPANCLRPFSVSISTDLNNPQLINVQTPGGSVELSGGAKGIILLNVNGSDFVAYDRVCPQGDCNSSMIYDRLNRPNILKCSCDGSEYGLGLGIGGAPQTEGFLCSAIEYKVSKNGSAIRISNF
ncbi:phosphoribosylaminoimidazole carboxylase [Polaribacter sp. PL03]|uniref:phosphoribosylaminoimidazole carboxylase n=1 Tax=Polaribacter sp. PL03 TaxID=3088353 RepID=UPI0029CEB098|nr:phosphoribosylaminoimidazole carboxylase [Polaribacter sp. PL03]MDX6747556.1 phosphoribosylaminoimidazole carboxylase [Polaribacter sp. PL03]